MNWELKKFYDSYAPDNADFYLAKTTLRELIVYADDNGVTFVGNKTIAESVCLTPRTVSRHIKVLTDMKIVSTLKKGGKTTSVRKVSLIGHREDIEETQRGNGEEVEETTVGHREDTQMSNEEKLKEKVRKEKSSDAPLRSTPNPESPLLVWFDEDLWGWYRKSVNEVLAKLKEPPRTPKKADAKKKFNVLIKAMKKKYKNATEEDFSEAIETLCNEELKLKYPRNLNKILDIDMIADMLEDLDD